jgi:hypothetical protein
MASVADISLRALLSRFANSTPASRPSAVPRRGHKLVPSAKAGRAAAVTLPSIAVLPFESLDVDDRAARLADGLTDEIIADLARHPDIFVIARHSVLCYGGGLSACRMSAASLVFADAESARYRRSIRADRPHQGEDAGFP